MVDLASTCHAPSTTSLSVRFNSVTRTFSKLCVGSASLSVRGLESMAPSRPLHHPPRERKEVVNGFEKGVRKGVTARVRVARAARGGRELHVAHRIA